MGGGGDDDERRRGERRTGQTGEKEDSDEGEIGFLTRGEEPFRQDI